MLDTITVKELISILSNLPENAPIIILAPEYGYFIDPSNIVQNHDEVIIKVEKD